jgi:thiol-disulfide isomerase/thioredoxin
MEGFSKRTYIFLLCGVFIVVTLLGAVYYVYLSPSGWKARQNAVLSQIESEAIVSYVALDGSEVDLTTYNSEVLVVNVWASWSPYTKADHEILQAMKERFGDRITIRAVNRKEPRETAEAYLATIGREEGIEYIIDTTDHLYDSLGGYAMPETIVFDRIGNVSFHKRGTLSSTELQSELERLLTQKK